MPQIDHIIVLMMENRSLDNLAGWLYDPERPARFLRAQAKGLVARCIDA